MRNRIIISAFFLLMGIILCYSCQTEQELTYARYYVNGKGVYEKHCQQCHGKNGEGLKALYPPLTDSVSLKKNKSRLACFIRYGMAGKWMVNGQVYDAVMPAEEHLSDIDVAAVITYITNSFGNKQGLYDQKAATEDLKNCK